MSLRERLAAIARALLDPGRLVLDPGVPHKPVAEWPWTWTCVCGEPASHPVYGTERPAR